MVFMNRTITILAMLSLLAAAPAQGQDPDVPIIAVMEFNVVSMSQGDDVAALGQSLAAMLTTEMARRPTIRTVERQALEDLIRTRQLSATGRVDDELAMEYARLAGADFVVYGNVMLVGDEARLDLKMTDAWGQGAVKSDKRRGSRADFLAMVQQIADAFSTDVPVISRPAEPTRAPATAVLAYSRGLNYERRGMAPRAMEMFRNALELAPDYEAAVKALARVSRGGGR
jgi:TolB-like protein